MLDTETLYVIGKDSDVQWARTPDGVGLYWYDEDDEDAKTDVCDFKRVRYFDTSRQFDDFRAGEEFWDSHIVFNYIK